MKPLYVLHTGEGRIIPGGEVTHLNMAALALVHQISLLDCISVGDIGITKRLRTPRKLVHLYPSMDGEYVLPEVEPEPAPKLEQRPRLFSIPTRVQPDTETICLWLERRLDTVGRVFIPDDMVRDIVQALRQANK